MFRRYCIQNVKDGIQIKVYNINNESVNNFGQFILVKVTRNLRKSQAQFREKLRKLRLRQNNDFLLKKRCNENGLTWYCPLNLSPAASLRNCFKSTTYKALQRDIK